VNGHQLADTKSASTKMEGNCLSTDDVDANQGLEYVVEVSLLPNPAKIASWRLSWRHRGDFRCIFAFP
jgi:hypothetical protein